MFPESNYDYEEHHSKRFLPSDDPLEPEIEIHNFSYPISQRTDPRIKNFNYKHSQSLNKIKNTHKKAGLFKNKYKKSKKLTKYKKPKTKNHKKKHKSKKTKKN